MEPILNAKDFWDKTYDAGFTVEETMIEFATAHVQAALMAAWQNASATNKPKFKGDCNPVVDDDSLLTAYSLENIK